MATEVFDWETTTTLAEVSWEACEEQERLVSELLDRISEHHINTPKHVDIARVIQVLTPIVALFGILGNTLNLVVLTRKSLRYTMDHLEKSAHTSLIALAVSDALICIVYTVKSAMPRRLTMFYSRHGSQFPLHFDMYHEGLFNVL